MPVSISWYDDTKHVIFQRYEGKWTWEDFSHASQETRTLADSVPHNMLLFIDMSQASQMPQGNVLSYGRTAFNTMPNNMRNIIVALQSHIVEVFAEVVIKMLPHWRNRVHFTKTLEEGQRLVAEAVAKNSVGN